SAVLYDIHNEAHDIDFLSWKSRAAEIIEAIQSVHPDALILVSGLNWASDLSDWAASPFDYENIVYSVHVYTWFGTSANWGTRFGNYAQNIPIFCGEFGGYESDIQWGKELIRYLNQNQIGWTAWSWVDDPHLTSRDDHTTPTEFGQLVKTSLERFEEMSSSENEIFDISFDFITASRAT
ncbi:MAG: glycoside hydrolase family 5 protein, partial [Gammaproteobacteria bacterium]|nr:glycoside hydrolase family 5 protein [Gammaproteobacteria bacterium]